MFIWKATFTSGDVKNVVTELDNPEDVTTELTGRGFEVYSVALIDKAYVISKTKFI